MVGLESSYYLDMKPEIQGFFDPNTCTVSYVVYEADGSDCAIVDSVLDYDPKSGRTSSASADRIVDFVRAHRLNTVWLLETHAHADHLSAAPYLQEKLGGRIGIGAGICKVQHAFSAIFNRRHEKEDGSQFGHLFQADEVFAIGRLEARALHVPGHTPADIAYQVGDAVFVGARCDFPGGCASDLYRSVRRLLSLPEDTRLFMCHDYPPAGREPRWEVTVGEQRAANIHIRDGISEEEFVAMRTQRDATLQMPVLILPAIQVNLSAGHLPEAEDNGIRYLKIPLNAL